MNENQHFDLSAFNALSPAWTHLRLEHIAHRPLSAPFEILRFDFEQGGLELAGEHVLEIAPIQDGLCHAAVFWLKLELDEETTITTAPEARSPSWRQTARVFSEPVALEKGRPLTAHAAHDTASITFELTEG